MKVAAGRIVALGYGKYFRSDRIVGLQPIEEGRGPGRRTFVYVEEVDGPIIASRSDGAILHDMVADEEGVSGGAEQRHLLADILDTIEGLEPLLRNIIRQQAGWDLDRLEERIQAALGAAGESS